MESIEEFKAESEHYTKTDILKRGWTNSMINKFLDQPCQTKHSRFPNYPEINLFTKKRVEDIENTEDWLISFKESSKRSAKFKEKAIEFAESAQIEVQKLKSDYQLRKQTVDSHNAYEKANSYDFIDMIMRVYPAHRGLNPKMEDDRMDLDRIVVNYILYKLSNFSDLCKKTRSKVAKRILKIRTLEVIAKRYRKYAPLAKNKIWNLKQDKENR